MKKMWIVRLIKAPQQVFFSPWPSGFFPRKFWYKSEAQSLKMKVELLGGLASVEREE